MHHLAYKVLKNVPKFQDFNTVDQMTNEVTKSLQTNSSSPIGPPEPEDKSSPQQATTEANNDQQYNQSTQIDNPKNAQKTTLSM